MSDHKKWLEQQQAELAKRGDLIAALQARIVELEEAQLRVKEFPVVLRKMWSGSEVRFWIDEALNPTQEPEDG